MEEDTVSSSRWRPSNIFMDLVDDGYDGGVDKEVKGEEEEEEEEEAEEMLMEESDESSYKSPMSQEEREISRI
jgi:hypothetical protein